MDSSVSGNHSAYMVGQYIRTSCHTYDSRDQTHSNNTRTMKTQLNIYAAPRNSKRSNCEVIKVEIIKVAPDSYRPRGGNRWVLCCRISSWRCATRCPVRIRASRIDPLSNQCVGIVVIHLQRNGPIAVCLDRHR